MTAREELEVALRAIEGGAVDDEIAWFWATESGHESETEAFVAIGERLDVVVGSGWIADAFAAGWREEEHVWPRRSAFIELDSKICERRSALRLQ